MNYYTLKIYNIAHYNKFWVPMNLFIFVNFRNAY